MQRMAFPALVEALIDRTSFQKGVWLFLVDSDLIQRLLYEKSMSVFQTKPDFSDDLKILSEKVDHLATPPLFGEPSPVLFRLPAKLTKTQWKEALVSLSRLSLSNKEKDHASNPPLWLIGGTALRKVTELESAEKLSERSVIQSVLTYAPQRNESARSAMALLNRFSQLQAEPAQKKQELVNQAVSIYETDFSLIDAHFQRMNETGLAFEEIFLDTPVMGTYQLIEAVASENALQVQLRLSQCQQNAEEPSKIIASLNSFFRQYIRFAALVNSGKTESQVFQILNIPFPAQAKFSAARKRLKLSNILTFLTRSANIELQLRQSSRSYDLLTIEFIALLS